MDDAEAQSLFEEHKERYEKGAEISLRFIKLDPQNFITGEDLQAYYTEHRGEFKTPEAVKARHILKKFPDNATDEQKAEVKAEAEKLLETVKAAIVEGEDFAELAKEHSRISARLRRAERCAGEIRIYRRVTILRAATWCSPLRRQRLTS